MEIKTSLKKLQVLFGQSAATESLDPAVRRFAAQLTVLSAHVMRVEAKLDAERAAREAFAVELRDVLATFAATLRQTYPAAVPTDAETTDEAAAPVIVAAPGAVDEDPDKKTLLEQLQQEGEADKQATLAKEPPAGVTPLRKASNAGKSKPSTPGAA